MPSIFFEMIVVLNNFGYKGLNQIFELIDQCDGFFKIIFVKPNQRHVTQFFYSFIVENADLESVTFCLDVKGVSDISVPVLSLVLQAYNLTDAGTLCKIEDILLSNIQELYQQDPAGDKI